MVEGARGTLVFGQGVNALKCEVLEVGDGWVMVQEWDAEPVLVVPVSSIVYFRYAGESE
jgi:hypothetical protein